MLQRVVSEDCDAPIFIIFFSKDILSRMNFELSNYICTFLIAEKLLQDVLYEKRIFILVFI